MIELKNKSDCCGCTACESVCGHHAIQLKEDVEGFLYPHIDTALCINCRLCEKVCPIVKYDAIEDKTGCDTQRFFALSHKDDSVKEQSSSGATFHELAANVLNKDGVVYGAVFDACMNVVHCRICDKENIHLFYGSKYVQSDLRGVFRQVKSDLSCGKHVLFSGTPCQVEGLKLYLHREYGKLLTVDVVCHGVPSPMLFRKYVKMLECVYGKKVQHINMRDKKKGWKQRYHFRIKFEDGTEIYDTRHGNMWNEMFFSENISRPSCHSCRFTNYCRPSDITIADFWGIEKRHPEYKGKGGVSLVMSNTPKGELAINGILQNYDHMEVSKEETLQPCLQHSVTPNPARTAYWKDVKTLSFDKLLKKYHRYAIMNYYWHLYRLEFHIWRTENFRKNK